MPPRIHRRIHEASRQLVHQRAAGDLDEARLEAELLYAEAAGWDRAKVIASGSQEPEQATLGRFEQLVERRLAHEPLAYIRGRREFYNLDLAVGPGVLIPRPETETLVEAALAALAEHPGAGRPLRIVDVGTGCGAVALALATHAPGVEVLATERSAEALAWARRNRARLGLEERVSLIEGDLLEPVARPVDVIVANLPYIPTAEYRALPPEIREHEPRGAVDGGADGLDAVRALAPQLRAHLADGPVAVLLEIGAGQADAVSELLRSAIGGEPRTHRDLFGARRVVEAQVGYQESGGSPSQR